MFERNGNRGDEIMQHPHFLKYLRYFLFGADLPADMVAAFSERVKSLSPISSGDQEELWELAREQLNARRLEPSIVADEYFKLCLDCGVHVMHAKHIREVIKQMRLRKAA